MFYLWLCTDYQNDSFSNGNPTSTICGRCDLFTERPPMAYGCYDTKVLSVTASDCIGHRGATPKFLGESNPSVHLLSHSLSLLFPPFPSLLLEVGPLNIQLGGLEECFFFVSRWNRAILAVISPCGTLQNVVLRFLI